MGGASSFSLKKCQPKATKNNVVPLNLFPLLTKLNEKLTYTNVATQAHPALKSSFVVLPALANLKKNANLNQPRKFCPVEFASSFDQPQGKADPRKCQVKLKCICSNSAQKKTLLPLLTNQKLLFAFSLLLEQLHFKQ